MRFDPTWFSVQVGSWCRGGRIVRLFEAFRRHTADGDRYAGLNVGQVNRRHLFYLGRFRIGGSTRWEWSLLGSRRRSGLRLA